MLLSWLCVHTENRLNRYMVECKLEGVIFEDGQFTPFK